jgi:DNA-binding NarL/FixJ family response regulator
MKSIASGMPDKQIADELGISFYTVRNHIKALYKKTSCHNKAALIVFAKNNNVV